MKYCITILLSLCVTLTAKSQEKNCSKFKNGTFKMITEQGTFIIKRTDSIQVETKIGDKVEMEFIVKWVDSCTYTLYPTKKTFKSYPKLPKDGILTVTINEVKAKSYIQTTTSNFADFKLTNEITLIE